MIHQPSGGAGGQAADIAIAAKEILRWRRTLSEVIARHTGKPQEQVDKDSDRDYYMSAQEAKDYGIVDHVVASTREAPDPRGEDRRLTARARGGSFRPRHAAGQNQTRRPWPNRRA